MKDTKIIYLYIFYLEQPFEPIFYTLSILVYLFTWKRIAKSYSKSESDKRNQCRSMENSSPFLEDVQYQRCPIFMEILYLFEFIESINTFNH